MKKKTIPDLMKIDAFRFYINITSRVNITKILFFCGVGVVLNQETAKKGLTEKREKR